MWERVVLEMVKREQRRGGEKMKGMHRVLLGRHESNMLVPPVSATLHAKSFQSCPTLCDPTDCSPPGSSVHGDSPGKDNGVSCHARLRRIF